MEFIEFDEIAQEQKNVTLRARTQITMVQKVVHKASKTPSIVTEFRLSPHALEQARLKIGDQVSIGKSKCGEFIRIKAHTGNVGGYKIGSSTRADENTSTKAGVLKATWYKGMPLIGDFNSAMSVRSTSIDEYTQFDVGTVIFKFGPSEVLRYKEEI